MEEVFLKCTRTILSKIDGGERTQLYTMIECADIWLVFLCDLGELDPDRVGSGIQYGNAQLRKVTPGTQQTSKDKCSC